MIGRVLTPQDWLVDVVFNDWTGRERRKTIGVTPTCTEEEARVYATNQHRRSIVTENNKYGLPIGFHLPPNSNFQVVNVRRRCEEGMGKTVSRYQQMLARYT